MSCDYCKPDTKLPCLCCGSPVLRESSLNDLLQRLGVALDDWMRMYAPEFCDEKNVEETRKRISAKGGTLAYIADLRQEIGKAL